MATSRNWFKLIRRKFVRSSARDIIVVHTEDSSSNLHEETIILEHPNSPPASTDSTTPQKQVLTKQDIAAIKVQAFFRGHLARRAFRALKSLVKLQALVRGAYVRRQSRIALHCMHSLVRLQVNVRARQLLSTSSNGRSTKSSDIFTRRPRK
ncbi:hypothetical protein FEM48_Zijuj08G0082900 [Ziziphus jujuba var. spinosa]|uniref:Uncharacterized protein n=1 Tax=Ziziphus jujuba var. spinosa TaxID=714518 RepID=A0A978UY02_ZIZJJ|nr:hypothetical protein FEM48_Zijuj08G0082900 [Ziziphus jujuba var. spinosa]